MRAIVEAGERIIEEQATEKQSIHAQAMRGPPGSIPAGGQAPAAAGDLAPGPRHASPAEMGPAGPTLVDGTDGMPGQAAGAGPGEPGIAVQPPEGETGRLDAGADPFAGEAEPFGGGAPGEAGPSVRGLSLGLTSFRGLLSTDGAGLVAGAADKLRRRLPLPVRRVLRSVRSWTRAVIGGSAAAGIGRFSCA